LKNKITIIGLNFHPEDTAIGLYTTQLAEYLSHNNFKVEVITGFPYYPSWKIAEAYKKKPNFFKETINNIDIIRYKQYVPKNPTFIKRILLLLDFTFGCYINSFKIKQTDLVLTIVPFTSSVLIGNQIAKRNKAKHWVHIQDFEFDAAADTDLVGNKSKIFKFLFWIEKKLLNKANSISTISNAMLAKLQSKVSDNVSTHLLPNWVDVANINPEKAKKHPFLKSDNFKILYSGNIGEKQDWNLFLEVVDKLKNEKIDFIVVGSGSKKDWLIENINECSNVQYHPPVAYKELSDLLCSADLHILFQKNNVVDTVMPSKILGMMASAKPSIITGNLKSEVATVMRDSNSGLYIESSNIENVVNSILTFTNTPNSMGENARNYVSTHFSSEQILSKFLQKFKEII